MLGLTLNIGRRKSPNILLFGAHSDDIEIGCGGTVLELLELYPNAHIYWIVLSAGSEARVKEANKAAKAFLKNARHSSKCRMRRM